MVIIYLLWYLKKREATIVVESQYMDKSFQFNQLTCCYNEVENW